MPYKVPHDTDDSVDSEYCINAILQCNILSPIECKVPSLAGSMPIGMPRPFAVMSVSLSLTRELWSWLGYP